MISEIAGPIYIGMTLGLDSSKVVNDYDTSLMNKGDLISVATRMT